MPNAHFGSNAPFLGNFVFNLFEFLLTLTSSNTERINLRSPGQNYHRRDQSGLRDFNARPDL
jgi:hypothetical protein